MEEVRIEATKDELERCEINEWFPMFEEVSFKTKLIKLPQSFVNYLLDEEAPLPKEAYPIVSEELKSYNSEIDREKYEKEEEDLKREEKKYDFKELEEKIGKTVEEYKAVFPKLNWSSPKDACWVTTSGNLKCTSASQVFLLLKSSDFISHDLSTILENNENKRKFPGGNREREVFLALRKFYSILPSQEFRCFVKNRKLVAVCQRNCDNFFQFLLEKEEEYKERISNFFRQQVEKKFVDPNFVFDVYVTQNGRVYLVDFNVWGTKTDPLMFEWKELEELETSNNQVKMEIVRSETKIVPPLSSQYGVPVDVFNMENMEQWIEVMKKARNEQTKEDERI